VGYNELTCCRVIPSAAIFSGAEGPASAFRLVSGHERGTHPVGGSHAATRPSPQRCHPERSAFQRSRGTCFCFSRSSSTTKNGCPILASLGWDTTNPNILRVISSGWSESRDSQFLFTIFIDHKKWVPHPSFARVGYREPFAHSLSGALLGSRREQEPSGP
jgi:hypothetical protein